MNESDYPLEVFHWEGVGEVTPEYLRWLTGEDTSAPVETMSAAEFFRAATSEASWKGEAELATARKFQALVRVLEERLEGLAVFRVGNVTCPSTLSGVAHRGVGWVLRRASSRRSVPKR